MDSEKIYGATAIDKSEMRDLKKIVDELHEQHQDAIKPLIAAVNEASLRGDGNSLYYFSLALEQIQTAIVDLLRSRPIISEDQATGKTKIQ